MRSLLLASADEKRLAEALNPDDSTVSMMNLSLNPSIIADIAMNLITLIVTPAMHTSDWRLCERK